MRFVDADDPAKGLVFDGRLAEDFKLSTGTWVSVGPLRARLLAHGAGYVQDVVIAGHDRDFVAALVFPNLPLCRGLCPDLGPTPRRARSLLDDPRVLAALPRARCEALAAQSTRQLDARRARASCSTCRRRIDARELTDKGSLEPEGRARRTARRGSTSCTPTPPPAHVILLRSGA